MSTKIRSSSGGLTLNSFKVCQTSKDTNFYGSHLNFVKIKNIEEIRFIEKNRFSGLNLLLFLQQSWIRAQVF
ncbi:MAG: hypothetical protein DRR19_29705 [Candidatus Parabeggiatoa sp. nov. 1]|nr:MAG: hypothetical protein DRR19_29705 [Gammaproteobacteria bacterium]